MLKSREVVVRQEGLEVEGWLQSTLTLHEAKC